MDYGGNECGGEWRWGDESVHRRGRLVCTQKSDVVSTPAWLVGRPGLASHEALKSSQVESCLDIKGREGNLQIVLGNLLAVSSTYLRYVKM